MPSCVTRVPWGPSLRSGLFHQTSGLTIPSSASAWWTVKTMEEEERLERRRRQRQQVVSCCKQLVAFLFSHIGLAAMVVAYSIMGGFLFRAIEAPAEQQQKLKVIALKEKKIQEILDAVIEVCEAPGVARAAQNLETLTIEMLNNTLKKAFAEFQGEVKYAVKEMGWDGNDDTDESALQWSLAGAILYAVTVITTIGYGHIAPKTRAGRMLTILYALIGIPLTFLYLSNIGNFLADCFRLFYKRICCDIVCCQKCERKRKRERLKLRRRREMAAQRNILLGIHSQMLSGLPANRDDEDDDDDDASPSRIAGLAPPVGVTIDDGTAFPYGDENQGFEWESHCDNNDDEREPSTSAAETFPSTHNSPSSVRSKEEVDDNDETEEERTPSIDNSSVETVRETAILEDENLGEYRVRETAIVEDTDFSSAESRRSEFQIRERMSSGRTRTPSFHANGFHLLDSAKETDILQDTSIDGDSNRGGRLSRLRHRSQRYQSDPFLHVPSSPLTDNPHPNRCPASAGVRVPLRSFTVKPHRYASKVRTPGIRRQGGSVPARSNSKQHTAKERWKNLSSLKKNPLASKPHSSKDDAVQMRAKANWQKVIEYTKQLAAKEHQERTGKQESWKKKLEGKQEKSSDGKKKFFHLDSKRSSRRNTTEMETRNKKGWTQVEEFAGEASFRSQNCSPGVVSPSRFIKSPFHQSDESFVTAASESAESDGGSDVADDSGDFPATKLQSPSLNSVAIDLMPLTDDQELPDFPDFIQDQPIGFLDDPFDYEEEEEQEGKVTVPISICLIIISGYLFAGSALFAVWEQWDLVTGSYFCFITLSTIGFGDIVPGTDMKEWASEAKLVLCALWLAFGLSLLAMCFNLMQEEVKDKCKWIGQKLGLLKDEGQS